MKIMEYYSDAGFDPTSTVFLEESVPGVKTKNFTAGASIIRYEHQSVVVHATASGTAVLVLADSYFPGWRVYVDGREEKLLRANYFFRGVRIEPGEHRIEFKYEPMPFKIGLIVSTTAALVLCLVTALALLKTRRQIAEARYRFRLTAIDA